MSGIKIRKSQILQPFGVGAIIEAEGRSYVVKPTTSWKTEDMYDISIGSLAGRIPSIQKILTPKDGEKDGKTIFQLPVKRFPRWYFCSNNNCRKMYRLTDKEPDYCKESKCKKKQLIAMRWIMICEDGHMWDIPWQDYCHRNNLGKVTTPGPCDSTNLKFKTERGGDFDQMRIVCSDCKAENTLDFIKDDKPKCHGYHAWSFHQSNCEKRLKIQPRGSSAIHFPKLISALDLSGDDAITSIRDHPIYDTTLQGVIVVKELLDQHPGILDNAHGQLKKMAEEYGIDFNTAKATFDEDLYGGEEESTSRITEEYNLESLQLEIIGQEFHLLAKSADMDKQNLRTTIVDIRQDSIIKPYIKKLVRIERVAEVRAFTGFSRIDSSKTEIQADLGGGLDWVPGVKVFGEGIFFQIDSEKLELWKQENALELSNRLKAVRFAYNHHPLGERLKSSSEPDFVLLHTLSHIFISQLAFEAGYSANALRERIYAFPEVSGYGILVYTAESDSEGSLGGLQELGKIDKFEKIFIKSINSSSWCSNDPVCRESEGVGVQALNRAACHACSLLPETTCVYNNTLLDRVLLTGNADDNKEHVKGFFSDLI